MLLNKLNELRAQSDEEGFTLIELMIVVVIIGILAAIAIPIFANQQKESHKAGVKSDVRNSVTNVATFLATDPDAADLSTVASVTSEGSIINISGSWDEYTVKGKTNSVDDWCLVFSSTTGKYVEASGTDCAFTATTGGGPIGGGEEEEDETPAPFTTQVSNFTDPDMDGWVSTAQSGYFSTVSGGRTVYLQYSGSGYGPTTLAKTITGQTVGKTYRVTVVLNTNVSSSATAIYGHDSMMFGVHPAGSTVFSTYSYTYTATSTSTPMELTYSKQDGNQHSVQTDSITIEEVN